MKREGECTGVSKSVCKEKARLARSRQRTLPRADGAAVPRSSIVIQDDVRELDIYIYIYIYILVLITSLGL